MAYCEGPGCGDAFHPDESSDGRFCSWECREAREAQLDENEEDYDMGYGPDVSPRLADLRRTEFDEMVHGL